MVRSVVARLLESLVLRCCSLLICLLAVLLPGSAWAHTFSLSVASTSECGYGDVLDAPSTTAPYAAGDPACFDDGQISGDLRVARLTDSGPTSDSGSGTTTLANAFAIDAAVAADSVSGDLYQELTIAYDLTFTIDVDDPADSWSLTLDHEVAGLLALHGDGTATATGSQRLGRAQILAVDLSGDVTTSLLADTFFQDNPGNNDMSSQPFSDSATGILVASGTGDAAIDVAIAFRIDAFSNDGCTGFICISISGGEEAAVLLGFDDASGLPSGGTSGISVDKYATWSRSVAPDGYTSAWTLDVTSNTTPSVPALGGSLLALLSAVLTGAAALCLRRSHS